MSNVPAELLYTSDHEWVSALTDEGTVRIGITDHAQDALGDVVYVFLRKAILSKLTILSARLNPLSPFRMCLPRLLARLWPLTRL